MMNSYVIKVEGLDITLKNFGLMTPKVRVAAFKAAEKGAKLIQKRARELAPKRTGDLKKRIRVRTAKIGLGKFTYGAAPHTHLQEFGTRQGVKAKHFMQKAADNSDIEVLMMIEHAVRKAVDE